MGMDLRFYSRVGDTRSATLTLLWETRSSTLANAFGEVIGWGLNGSYNVVGEHDLEMVIKELEEEAEAERKAHEAFGDGSDTQALIKDVKGLLDDLTDEDEIIYYEWSN